MTRFAETLERVCVETVESGRMTKDLALLVGPDQAWLTTEEFLGALDENLPDPARRSPEAGWCSRQQTSPLDTTVTRPSGDDEVARPESP